VKPAHVLRWFNTSSHSRNRGSHRMKISSLKINLRSSGDRSRLSQTISRIRVSTCSFLSLKTERELVAGETVCAETLFFFNDSDILKTTQNGSLSRNEYFCLPLCLPSCTCGFMKNMRTCTNPTFKLQILKNHSNMTIHIDSRVDKRGTENIRELDDRFRSRIEQVSSSAGLDGLGNGVVLQDNGPKRRK
jgi:hypothetical protein